MKHLVIVGSLVSGIKVFGPFETKDEAEVYCDLECGDFGEVVPLEETMDFPAWSGRIIKREGATDDGMKWLDMKVVEVNYELGITIMRGDVKCLCLNRSLYGPNGEKGSYADYARKFWLTLKLLNAGPMKYGVTQEIYNSSGSGKVGVACAYSGF